MFPPETPTPLNHLDVGLNSAIQPKIQIMIDEFPPLVLLHILHRNHDLLVPFTKPPIRSLIGGLLFLRGHVQLPGRDLEGLHLALGFGVQELDL